MLGGMDIVITVDTIIKKITDGLGLIIILIVIYTDSFLLYEYLVKLGTTKEKRLMINVMLLRELYQRRELQEIRQINGKDNIADTLTKTGPNLAL